MLRKLGWAAALLVVAGCSPKGDYTKATESPAATTATTMAAGTTGGATAGSAGSAPVGATSGEFAAEVVSVDAAARTVTLREAAVGGTAAASGTAAGQGAAAGSTTVHVEGAAGSGLGQFKAGDRVVVSCTMGTAPAGAGSMLGSCSSVTAIKKAS